MGLLCCFSIFYCYYFILSNKFFHFSFFVMCIDFISISGSLAVLFLCLFKNIICMNETKFVVLRYNNETIIFNL